MNLIKKTIITRLGHAGKEGDVPYLIRWTLEFLTCKWFSVKIHKILLSDDDCLHDHPWNFLSIILKGGYWEETFFTGKDKHEKGFIYRAGPPEDPRNLTKKKWYAPGSILWRPSPWCHRLEVKKEPCWTLVIMFKKTREWGFHTKFGWIPWFKYETHERC